MAAQLELSQKPFIELQVEALVEENRVGQKLVNEFVDELELRLTSLNEDNKQVRRIFRVPLIGRPNAPNDDYPVNFHFRPPERIDIIGGFRTASAIKGKNNFIDLAISLPLKSIEKKDIKNQRYFHKRALYLAQIAHLLNGTLADDLVEKLEFRYHKGDFFKPVLLITPKEPSLRELTSFQLFIYPHSESGLKMPSLRPDHGNVAPKWFFKNISDDFDDLEIKKFVEQDSVACVTPFYNSSILFDMELVSNSDILFEQVGQHSSTMCALMLIKIWLHQRELREHFSFALSMFLAHLQTKQSVHPNMSPYQIFKTVLKSILTTNWNNPGLSYYEDARDKIPPFKSAFPVVFLSPSGNLNLCYNISEDSYERLRHEAQICLEILTQSALVAFDYLFLKKQNFFNKFDAVVHLPKCMKKISMDIGFLKKYLDYGAISPKIISSSIVHTAKTALTDRITLIQQSPSCLSVDKKWNLVTIPFKPSIQDLTFTFGLLLETEKSLRIIDVGPDAQSAEAEEFRMFWEPKCQLRIQSGVISETVVWHVTSFSQRRAIIKYILNHAMKKININNVVVHYTLLENSINLKNVFFQWKNLNSSNAKENVHSKKRKHEETEEVCQPIGVGEEVFHVILQSYNEFNKIVRNIEGLRYNISSIQPISHHLRASGVFPPLPVSLQLKNKSLKRSRGVTTFPENFDEVGRILHIEPIEILVSLDSSGKWPNTYSALEASKTEYLIELGDALKSREFSVKLSTNRLDVLYRQFVFRLNVKCPKELAVASSVMSKLEFQQRRLEVEVVPRVHSALDQLYREKPAFCLTCRIVKRWVSCQLMTDQLSDIVLDLLVAYTFLHPYPYTEPSSSLCGFRRFLELIAHFDWNQQPLIVNFDNLLKIDEINRIKNAMLEDRPKYPQLVICTPFDREISPWTRSLPVNSKIHLFSKICTQASQYLNEDILHHLEIGEKCQALFRPNFKIFNLLIKLKPQVLQNFFMSIDPPKNFKLSGQEPPMNKVSAFKVMPIVDLNFLEQYVRVLQSKYDDVASFFYDKYGQRIIGVILKPESEKILGGDLHKFTNGIKELGSKLIESVTVIKHES